MLVSAAPTSLPLLFSSATFGLSFCALLHLSFYLKLSGRNCLLSPPILSGYNGSLDTRFSQGMTPKKAGKQEDHLRRERKVQNQERILAEHLDGLKRNDFCDFDRPHKHAYQKGKIKSNEQSKEGGQPKSVCGKGREARQSQKL